MVWGKRSSTAECVITVQRADAKSLARTCNNHCYHSLCHLASASKYRRHGRRSVHFRALAVGEREVVKRLGACEAARVSSGRAGSMERTATWQAGLGCMRSGAQAC
eukprot:1036187-Pleurochrysis_carterae.AAC.1